MTWRIRIGLWVGLVVLFLLFYRHFNASPVEQSSAWSPSLLSIVFFVVFLFLFLFFFVRLRKGGRLTNEGVALIGQGRFLAAIEKFESSRSYWRGG